jgi:hypothetical protein
MKKINKVLLIAISALLLSATQSYASDSVVNRYVQLKDGVVFAYVESTREVGNSVLLPPNLTWEDVKNKKYENGTWVDATVIHTVTEIVNKQVTQTNSTVFSSDAKGDVVTPDVQTFWHRNGDGTYTSSPNSIERQVIQDTVTVAVEIVGTNPNSTFTNGAILSVSDSNNQARTTIEPNGLKNTQMGEVKEKISFDTPKTFNQVETSVESFVMIKKYLATFFLLLHGWILPN